jgi:Protein of unknown function (DUF3800)
MYLIFFDGTGNTGAQLDHPTNTIHYLVGLAIPSNRARALEDDVTAVLTGRFAGACRAQGFECKGSDMYRGEGPCTHMRPADRVALYEEMVSLLDRHRVSVIWQGIDKPALAARYARPMHPHKLAFLYFAESVERFLRAKNSYGLMISDEEKSVEQQVIEDLPRYKELGTGFGYQPLDLTKIVDNVHWVKSHNSRLLQLADNCTFLCQRYRRDMHKTTLQAQAVQRLWGIVEKRVWRGRVWP